MSAFWQRIIPFDGYYWHSFWLEGEGMAVAPCEVRHFKEGLCYRSLHGWPNWTKVTGPMWVTPMPVPQPPTRSDWKEELECPSPVSTTSCKREGKDSSNRPSP